MGLEWRSFIKAYHERMCFCSCDVAASELSQWIEEWIARWPEAESRE